MQAVSFGAARPQRFGNGNDRAAKREAFEKQLEQKLGTALEVIDYSLKSPISENNRGVIAAAGLIQAYAKTIATPLDLSA